MPQTVWELTSSSAPTSEVSAGVSYRPPLAGGELYNANPTVFASNPDSHRKATAAEQHWSFNAEDEARAKESDEELEEIDAQEVFDLLRSLTDPEHPKSLEDLGVLSRDNIHVKGTLVTVLFKPTQPHCGGAQVIGLAIKLRLERSLPNRFRTFISCTPESYISIEALTKQLNDKERFAAAMESPQILAVVEACLATAHLRGKKPGQISK